MVNQRALQKIPIYPGIIKILILQNLFLKRAKNLKIMLFAY